MSWQPPVKALLLAMAAASSSLGCAASEPQSREGVVGELVSAGEETSHDEFGISHGQVDVENRYHSVVQIESTLGRCSGVLVDVRLVLTAAHCFCTLASATATVIDNSNCVRSASVTSVMYKRSENAWKSVTDSSDGAVTVHAGFRSELTRRNGKAFVTARAADLAVVRLAEPLANAIPDGKIRSEEVLLHEEAIMAGFGATSTGTFVGRERRVGQNRVAMLRALDTQGAREIRWLVGINGGYVASETAPESWFTSTSSYREWIEKQIAEARKAGGPD